MPHLVDNTVLIPEMVRLLHEGKSVTFTPTGVSMRPFIEGGQDSVILIKADQLRVGDIVLAQITPNHYVLHRLIALQGDQVTLMGDGNLFGQEHCSRSDVLAKVQRIISPKGHRKPLTRGRLWLMLLPLRRLLLKVYRHTPRLV
ncbi:MAG: S24/S26 family peptidase [Paludibacteraceae bacterium]|nr:S24/S26 family peptidase [Paludibacteraceae bacterium]